MYSLTVFKGSPDGSIKKAVTKKPELTCDQFLVKVTAYGLCGTDVHYRAQDMVLGHEGVGVVEAIGPAVRQLKEGDHVGWGYKHDSCGLCELCQSGRETFFNPPIDIMPFLDQSTTLSSVVFWTSLVWGVKLLQAALNGNGQAVATADKIFGHIGPITPHRAIINGMHAKLSFRQLGYIESDHPGYDPEGGLRIQSLIAHSCAVDGTPLGTYLRPDAAEEFIRNRLGTGFRVVELAIQGLGTSEDLLRVHLLVNKMIRNSVLG